MAVLGGNVPAHRLGGVGLGGHARRHPGRKRAHDQAEEETDDRRPGMERDDRVGDAELGCVGTRHCGTGRYAEYDADDRPGDAQDETEAQVVSQDRSSAQPVGHERADLGALRQHDPSHEDRGGHTCRDQEHDGEEDGHLREALDIQLQGRVGRLICLRDGVGRVSPLGLRVDVEVHLLDISIVSIGHEDLVLDHARRCGLQQLLRHVQHAEVVAAHEELRPALRRPHVLRREADADDVERAEGEAVEDLQLVARGRARSTRPCACRRRRSRAQQSRDTLPR